MTGIASTLAVDQDRVDAVDAILRDWLDEPELLLLCGDWGDGAVMELVPALPPRLTAARYEGRFAGLRDLLLDDQAHHVHLDLARLNHVTYLVSPSVCFGFRPSFEVRLHASGADATQRFALALSLRWPYRDGGLARAVVARYFGHYRAHRACYPAAVSFVVIDAPDAVRPRVPFDWREVGELATASCEAAGACASAFDLEQLLQTDHPRRGVQA